MCSRVCACFWCTIVERPQRNCTDKNSNLCLLNGSREENEDFTVHECNSHCVEVETVEVSKCLWTSFSVSVRVCVHYYCELQIKPVLHVHASLQRVFVLIRVCTLKHTLFVFVTSVCVCVQAGRQAGRRAPLGNGLIQRGSTSKRRTAARASASLTLKWLLSHTQWQRERSRGEMEGERKENNM